jgi:hypothetical protein
MALQGHRLPRGVIFTPSDDDLCTVAMHVLLPGTFFFKKKKPLYSFNGRGRQKHSEYYAPINQTLLRAHKGFELTLLRIFI